MYSWKDRLIDWANQRGAWTHILMAAGIALVITAIILVTVIPSKGEVDANAVDIGKVKGTIGTIAEILGAKASQADLDDLSQNVTGVIGDLGDQENDITIIQNSLAELLNSPPEMYLTGTFGNYILHAKSSEAGDFTANIHLLYQSAIGSAANYTEALANFYAGITFTESTPTYIPVVTFNGTVWGLSEVWFNIGTFPLVANMSTSLNITCVGLNSTWEPSFAYVEVYPI